MLETIWKYTAQEWTQVENMNFKFYLTLDVYVMNIHIMFRCMTMTAEFVEFYDGR